MKSIEIPEGVEEISERAFFGCDITEIVLPKTLKKIDCAFNNDNDLNKIVINILNPVKHPNKIEMILLRVNNNYVSSWICEIC